jgi:hypothetical protein
LFAEQAKQLVILQVTQIDAPVTFDKINPAWQKAQTLSVRQLRQLDTEH